MIITGRRFATVFSATVLAGGGALMTVPAGAATSTTTAAVICPYEVKAKTTPKWLSATSVRSNGTWKDGNIISVYQGSGQNGRLKTTSGYWATATDLTSAGQCRS
ncbi:hypothetical protein [Nonomuraea diastatica]|uniref:SH3 domain-containing protein n=1 Tax=Nonomuraea diastatica TaxID=1848329 RepID=A0A4R4W3R5_9ACTN|nr:hypothetical protein [Nonomuraea diastatica]TDD11457.1 hypothetical protein E1294_45055 [Nonomuraea diastatica]